MGDSKVKGSVQAQQDIRKPYNSTKPTAQPHNYAGNGYDEQAAMVDPRIRAGVPISKADWAIKLSQANAVVDEVYSKLMAVMNDMAIGYSNAWNIQKAVIDDANKRIALEMDIVLGIFSAVAGHFGSELLGQVMKKTLFDNVYLMEGCKAIEKFASQQAIGAIKKSGMKGLVGTRPLDFSNEVQKRVNLERSFVAGLVSKMNYNPHVDPKKFVSTRLREAEVIALKVDRTKAERYFELELWKLWVKEKGADVFPDIGMLGPRASATVPKEIFDHIHKKFGLSKQDVLGWNPMLKGKFSRHISDETAAEFLMKEHPDWSKEKALKMVKKEYHIDPLNVAD